MKDASKQVDLLKMVKINTNRYQSKDEPKKQKQYVWSFLKKHRFLFWGVIFLLITQGILETALIFISRNSLSYTKTSFANSFWVTFFVLLTIFIVNSFFYIKQEKTIVVLFINDLRRRIFKKHLGNTANEMSFKNQADLIAKISYHLPLVSLGVSNSFFGIFRWLVYLTCFLIISYLAGLNILLMIAIFVVLSLIIAVSSYFVVKQYVSQEVTFYSQIIKHIDFNFSEKYFTKQFNNEETILKKFDALVKFDSIFRIRRDIWLKMGFKIVFALLLIISLLTHFFYNEIAIKINLISPDNKFLYFFMLIYLSRIINEALKIGLYFFQGQLGMSLTTTKKGSDFYRKNNLKINQEITFYGKKSKIFKTGKYYKNLLFNFKKGGRYLFYGTSLSGKTALAKLFAGISVYNSKAVKVKIDGQRFYFLKYQRNFNNFYFFDPTFYSERSLLEVVIGTDKEETDFTVTAQALKLLSDNKKLSEVITDANNFSILAKDIWSNSLKSFSLQALHCLFKKPDLIIIDNHWLDLNQESIMQIIDLISQKLPESIILVMAKQRLDNLNYDNYYNLDENFK